MKSPILPVVCFMFALLPLRVAAQTVIPSTTYGGGGSPVIVSAAADLTTNPNTVIVSAGATVTFHSTSKITLSPGFRASGNFYAMIGAFVDTDSDGLPDAWERAHGLDPNNSADAQNTAPGGLTYLSEYQLGRTLGTAQQPDSSNATELKINHPIP